MDHCIKAKLVIGRERENTKIVKALSVRKKYSLDENGLHLTHSRSWRYCMTVILQKVGINVSVLMSPTIEFLLKMESLVNTYMV